MVKPSPRRRTPSRTDSHTIQNRPRPSNWIVQLSNPAFPCPLRPTRVRPSDKKRPAVANNHATAPPAPPTARASLGAAVSLVLRLLGRDPDPARSKDHALLSVLAVGLVVATQNPMDLDYRALSNAGLWCIGRLQTDADRQRVVEGLAGGNGNARDDAASIGGVVKRLAPRWFVMRDGHAEGGPALLQPRYAMSFLRGPMTRTELKQALAAREQRREPLAMAGQPPPRRGGRRSMVTGRA
jgi:hypothetical protein